MCEGTDDGERKFKPIYLMLPTFLRDRIANKIFCFQLFAVKPPLSFFALGLTNKN